MAIKHSQHAEGNPTSEPNYREGYRSMNRLKPSGLCRVTEGHGRKGTSCLGVSKAGHNRTHMTTKMHCSGRCPVYPLTWQRPQALLALYMWKKTGQKKTTGWFLDQGPVKATVLNIYRMLNRNLSWDWLLWLVHCLRQSQDLSSWWSIPICTKKFFFMDVSP